MKIVSPKDEYEISKLFKTDSNVILDFYADWCGPCKVLSRSFEEISNENMFNEERINLKIKIGSMNKSDLIEMIGKIYEK